MKSSVLTQCLHVNQPSRTVFGVVFLYYARPYGDRLYLSGSDTGDSTNTYVVPNRPCSMLASTRPVELHQMPYVNIATHSPFYIVT